MTLFATMDVTNQHNRKRETKECVSDEAKRFKSSNNESNLKSTREFKLKQLSDSGNFRTNDDVHSNIDICPVMKVFMDTQYMQRLRYVKQLATAFFVYNNANHTRFEHSLGVAHLAKIMCDRIKRRQPYLLTTDKDVLCVTLAGLLHDIGHGPFSHCYESFRKRQHYSEQHSMEEEYGTCQDPEQWKHEDTSLSLIDAILKDFGLEIDLNNLDSPLKQIGDGIDAMTMRVFGYENSPTDEHDLILTSRDFIFIKECIMAKPLREVKEILNVSDFIGRTERQKEWLYDVVANRFSGLDVDKMDYFARDQRHTVDYGESVDVPMVNEALVAKAKCSRGKSCDRCSTGYHHMICYPRKRVEAAFRFFRTRYEMHDKVYQHKASSAAQYMVSDILRKADHHYLINGGNKPLPISRALFDPKAFVNLDDTIIKLIKESTSKELLPARELAERYFRRDLYKFAGDKDVDLREPIHKIMWEKVNNETEIASQILDVAGDHSDENGNSVKLDKDDIIVEKCSYDHGRKDKNPVLEMRFVERDNLSRSTKELPEAEAISESEYPTTFPRCFKKNTLRVFCRDSDKEKVDLLRHKFEQWKEQLVSRPTNTPSNLHFYGQDEASNDEESSYGGNSAARNNAAPMCTQESEDEVTPRKQPRMGGLGESPTLMQFRY